MFEDFDHYAILSPHGFAWDALLALPSTRRDSQPELLERLLGRLSAANISGIAEPDELVTMLDEMAEFEEEAQAERLRSTRFHHMLAHGIAAKNAVSFERLSTSPRGLRFR